MIIRNEIYGLSVEIDRAGRTPIRLTFEEVYPNQISSRSRIRYYCLIEIGMYKKKTGLSGNTMYIFERLGSFEIEDWFNFRKDLLKRKKLKSILGVGLYDELVKQLDEKVKGGKQEKQLVEA